MTVLETARAGMKGKKALPRLDNPIIQKEFLQASHRKRTFLLRASLPVLAIMLIAPFIMGILRLYGQDWRAISQIVRPVFRTGAWLSLIAFSVIASSYVMASVRDEWTHKTMEVLCVSPLSRMQIVYGKFIASLGKLLMAALALLPILGIWLHLGRLPRSIMLGTVAVVLGTVLFIASTTLLQAASFRPRGTGKSVPISLALPFWGLLALLDGFVWVANPILDAALPPRALHLVLSGSQVGGMTTGQFALLSFGILMACSLVALALSPWAFGRAFARYISGGKKKRGVVRGVRRFFLGRRPRMKVRENPFCWQEKGPPTRLLSRSLWIIYAVTAIVVVIFGFTNRYGFSFLDEAGFWSFIAIEGLGTLPVMAAFYGTAVFARDKIGGRSQALLLTGYPAHRFLWSKIRAAYTALRFSMLAVAILCCVMFRMLGPRFWHDEESVIALVMAAQSLLLGPAVGVIIGMAFSLVAKTPAQAMRGLLGSVLWMMALGWGFGIFAFMLFSVLSLGPIGLLFGILVVTVVLLLFTRRWAPWRLGLLLALNFYTLSIMPMLFADSLVGYGEAFVAFFLGSAFCCLLALLWFGLSMRLFDSGMAGENAGILRRRGR